MRNFTAAAAIVMLLTGVHSQHSVTFPYQSLCAVTESDVKIFCKFINPDHSNVTQREWYRVQNSEGEPQDLSKDPEYSGRVFIWEPECTLSVWNVRVSDSGVYNFRFKTQSSNWISAPSGVHLTVTDLQVKVDPNTVGQKEVKVTCSATCSLSTFNFYWYRNDQDFKYSKENFIVLDSTSLHNEGSYSCEVYESEHRSPPVYLKVTVSDGRNGYKKLRCITTCTLSNNPTYIWYKNRQRLPNQDRNELNLDVSSDDAGIYSCAVGGHEDLHSPVVYSPQDTRAVVLPSGAPVKGDSVTLSCISDANPPVLTFSWFKQRAAADTLLTTDQNYSISNINTGHSGLYYCTAHNLMGHHNSTPIHLHVSGSEENIVLKFSMVGLLVLLALILLLGALWMWRRKSRSAHGHSRTSERGQLQSAPVYDNVPASNHRQRVTSDDQENVAYASVVFKHTHIQEESPSSPPDTTDEEGVQYAAVKFQRSSAAPRFVKDEAADDSSQIYSKVQHIPRKTKS